MVFSTNRGLPDNCLLFGLEIPHSIERFGHSIFNFTDHTFSGLSSGSQASCIPQCNSRRVINNCFTDRNIAGHPSPSDCWAPNPCATLPTIQARRTFLCLENSFRQSMTGIARAARARVLLLRTPKSRSRSSGENVDNGEVLPQKAQTLLFVLRVSIEQRQCMTVN